jgi:cupin fold WbuC family metalloprotein
VKLSEVSVETGKQIFHSKSWSLTVDDELISDLIQEAKKNSNNKARLCIHGNPEETMQVTYLAFIAPYEDRVHCHPQRPEVLVPVIGKAESRTFDNEGNLLTTQIMYGGSGQSFSTEKGIWHSLKVLTDQFVLIEIGIGPFKTDSTLFFDKKGG